MEQGRAATAYAYAEAGSKLNKKKEYKSYVKKMPMLIMANGMGAAMAFAFAKGSKGGEANREDPWGLLYSQIEGWVKEKRILGDIKTNKLAQTLTDCPSTKYRAATVETLALLNWMKRFADALIDGDSSE